MCSIPGAAMHTPRRLKLLKGEARSPIPAGCIRGSSRFARLRKPFHSSSVQTRGSMSPQERMLLSRNLRTHPIAYTCFHCVDFETPSNATCAYLGCHVQPQKSSMLRIRLDSLTLQLVVSFSFYTRRLCVSSPRTQQTPLGALPSNNSGNINHRHSPGISVSHRLGK